MKNYGKKISGMMLLGTLLISVSSFAKVRSVRDRRDFERTVSRGGIVVVLFYQATRDRGELRRENKELIAMYEDVSNHKPYEDIDIAFLKVNRARPDLADLAALYGVEVDPAYIFFKDGKRLTDNNKEPIVLTGPISRIDLQTFIDTRYAQHIQQVVADKEKRTQQMLAEENQSWKPYFYPRDIMIRGYQPAERKENME